MLSNPRFPIQKTLISIASLIAPITPIPKRGQSLTMSTSHSFHDTHPDTYDRMSSGCTRTVAENFLPSLTPPITPSSLILDNACGNGLVTRLIKAAQPDARITCADLAPGMLELVRAAAAKNGWVGVDTEVLDVRDLKTLADDSFTHVLTNFGFTTSVEDVDGPAKAAREMFRVLKSGGVCVVTTWAERNFPAAMEAAASIIRPDEKPFTWDMPDEYGRGSWLMGQLEDAGFGHDVQVKSVDSRVEAGSLDELVENLLLFKDMFYKGYTDEEVARLRGVLKAEMRKLPNFVEGEGSAAVNMVAWVGMAWKK